MMKPTNATVATCHRGGRSLCSLVVLTAKGSEGEVFWDHCISMVSIECCVCSELLVFTRVGMAATMKGYDINLTLLSKCVNLCQYCDFGEVF